MKKIPTLFVRDYSQRPPVLTPVVAPGLEYILEGNASATEKLDGTCCLMREGRLFRRYELRPGKTAPADFEPADDTDPITNKQPGWVPVGAGPEDRWHRNALNRAGILDDGTYELVGPKIQGNPYALVRHTLVLHGESALPLLNHPLTFEGLRTYLDIHDIEGIVWWRESQPVAKLKRRDFGFEWPVSSSSAQCPCVS